MARKLTKLRIDEVSAVLRGAGEGCEVRLMKAHDARTQRQRFTDTFRKALEPQDPDNGDDIGDTDAKLSPELQRHINALILAVPTVTREQAANFLLHTSHGRELLRTLSTVKSSSNTRKEPPMDREQGLRKIVKESGGLLRVAKVIAVTGDANGISEHELSALAFEEAKKHALPGERPNTAFARWYSEPAQLDLRKAIQIAKSTPVDKAYPQLMDMKPVTVETGSSATADDSAEAYAQLQTMANAMRARSPELTIAQCFARVFEDQANAALAAKAHRRPSATTSYAMPT